MPTTFAMPIGAEELRLDDRGFFGGELGVVARSALSNSEALA
jgi:hypothetical protein